LAKLSTYIKEYEGERRIKTFSERLVKVTHLLSCEQHEMAQLDWSLERLNNQSDTGDMKQDQLAAYRSEI
jgi:hypothetical protein